MEILFLTLEDIPNYDVSDMYADVMKVFIEKGHNVHTISPIAKKSKERTTLYHFGDSTVLRLVGNTTQNCNNLIKKGLATLLIGRRFIKAIKKYYKYKRFDLILYSTPPITFVDAIRYVKKRDKSKTYLMLKDIFPQNAVDLEMLSTKGISGIITRYFRAKEKKLYKISDAIGCMSPANVEYLLKHNKWIRTDCVNVCPNSLKIYPNPGDKNVMRKEWGLPEDKTLFIYGGNLGKPQGVDFIINCLQRMSKNENAYFVIAGGGTEALNLQESLKNNTNVKIFPKMPKETYDRLVSCCDIGMIFLDYRFTIPNFPSRLLSYTQFGLPVLSVTDENTDIGKIAEENAFGWRCSSNNEKQFVQIIEKILKDSQWVEYGYNAKNYHLNNYLPEHTYSAIMEKMGGICESSSNK